MASTPKDAIKQIEYYATALKAPRMAPHHADRY